MWVTFVFFTSSSYLKKKLQYKNNLRNMFYMFPPPQSKKTKKISNLYVLHL